MTKAQIVKFRDQAKKNNKQIFMYLDNSLTFYDGLRDSEFLIWDDANEVVTVLGPIRDNTSQTYLRAETPYEMYQFSYEHIQGIGVYMNYANLSKEVEALKSAGLITADKAKEILEKMAPLSRANVSAFSRTMRTYTTEQYKQSLTQNKENN